MIEMAIRSGRKIIVLATGVAVGLLMAAGCARQWGKFWETGTTATVIFPFNVTTSNTSAVTNFSPGGPFVIDLSVAIDGTSVTANTTIGSTSCSGSVQVSLDNFATCISLKAPVLSNSDTRLTITPLPFMRPLTTYRVRLSTALKSYQGLSLTADFTTGTYTTRDFGKWIFSAQFTGAFLNYATLNYNTGAISTFSIVANLSITIPLAVDPTGKVVVSSNIAGTAFQYSTINQGTGVPSSGASFSDPNSTFNRGFIFHPTLPMLYGAANNNTVTQYSINLSTGLPSGATNLALAGSTPTGIGIHPTGKFVYVSSSGVNAIYTVSLDQTTGALTGTPTQVFAGGSTPQMPVVDPAGKFLYSANNGSNTLSYYSINSSTGAPTLLGSIGIGNINQQGAAIDPTGRWLYIVNTGSSNFSVFSINGSTGVPTLIQTVSTPNSPTFVATDASGKFVFISCGSTGNVVQSFLIDQQTGLLPVTPTSSQAATNSQGIGVY